MTGEINSLAFRWLPATLLAALAAGQVSLAQAPEGIVHWAVSVNSANTVRQGNAAALGLSGEVSEGWHVYALAQLSGGPTPLRVTLDDNPIARLAGSPSGTPPEEKHDASFDLDTRFYRHSFALHVPIAVKRRAELGAQLIPVDVRFQSCSERECLPPKTIRLSVPITVLPGT